MFANRVPDVVDVLVQTGHAVLRVARRLVGTLAVVMVTHLPTQTDG